MAMRKDINSKGFCDTVYSELSGMRDRILGMREDLDRTYGTEDTLFGTYDRHLRELADQIEWKLQILSHACPFDWKGSVDYEENVVSVGQAEIPSGPDFSPGYVGG